MSRGASSASWALIPILLAGASACTLFDRSPAVRISAVQAPAGAAVSPDDVYYDAAVRVISARDYGRALDYLQEARQKQPDDVRVLNAFGVVYDKLGRFDLSARYYEEAKKLDPGSPIVAANLTYSALLQGQADKSGAAPKAAAAAAPAAPVPLAGEPQITPRAVAATLGEQTVSPAPAAPEQLALAEPSVLPSVTNQSDAAPAQSTVAAASPPASPPAAPPQKQNVRPIPYTAALPALPALSAPLTPSATVAAQTPAPAPDLQPIPHAVAAALAEVSAPIAPPQVVAALPPPREQSLTPIPYAPVAAALPPLSAPAAPPAVAAPMITIPGPSATTAVISELQVQIANAVPTAPAATAAPGEPPAAVIPVPAPMAISVPVAPKANSAPVKTAPAVPSHAHLLIVPAPTTAARPTRLASAVPAKPAVPVAPPARTAGAVRPATPATAPVRIPFALASVHASNTARPAATPAPTKLDAPAKKPVLIGSPLVIINASGQTGASEPLRQHLASLRWTAPRSAMSDGTVQSVTIIRYAPSNTIVAHALARSLPFPSQLIACERECGGLRVVLGRDFLKARFVKSSAGVKPG